MFHVQQWSVVTNLTLGLPVHVLGAVLACHHEGSGVAGDIAHAGVVGVPAGGVGDEHEALESGAGVVKGESDGAVSGVHGVGISSVDSRRLTPCLSLFKLLIGVCEKGSKTSYKPL